MIVTFYSFKGGVGRSSALVEVAAQLAAQGRSVVVWDLDLEAPGLQKMPDLQSLDQRLEIGSLDLLLEFQKNNYTLPREGALRRAVIDLPLYGRLAKAQGRLSFLLPARLDDGYAAKFSQVDWAALFEPEGAGPAFFHSLAGSLLQELGYEIVLVDSRTGYTDLGAVCTLQLPDLVVLVFNFNEQNLAGIERVHLAVTQTPARHSGTIPVFLLANMLPDRPRELYARKKEALAAKGLRPHAEVILRPELLLSDRVPTLAGMDEAAAALRPVVEEIESRMRELEATAEAEARSRLSRAKSRGDEEELETLRRRGIYEKAKTFEDKVAELFALLGYRTTVDYKRDDLQLDIRLEASFGSLPIHALVECKDTERPVTQQQVRDFASKVEYVSRVDKRPYQAILVARSAFANNAHTVAENLHVNLQTFQHLLLSLVDLRPNLEAATRAFQGTPLERLYVEQSVVLEADIRPGEDLHPRGLTDTVLQWLDQPGDTFLTLLGDFGCGKTSFCKRLACELAQQAKERPDQVRTPVLIDLREGGSTTVTLENLLTYHFQRLSSQPFNPQALLHLNREGYLLLIFDGFDETIAYSEPGRYVENLRQILRAAEGKAKVLLTCRTHYFRDRPEALRRLGKAPEIPTTTGATRLYEEIQERPGAEVGYVLEFGEEQVREYLRKALPPPADPEAFREQIRRRYNLEDLAQRPVLLEMIVKTLPRLTAFGNGEVSIADLYEAYCEGWFQHTDFRLTLTRERKVALVEYLARLIWDSPENRVHYEVLSEKAAEFFKDRPFTVFERERVDYEVRTALFLRRDAEGHYSFIHRSFLEFFIARTLRAGLVAGNPGCLDLRRLTREVVFFLELWAEAQRIPDLSCKVLEQDYRPRISENALLLLYLHARASLGPLLGTGAEGDDGQADLGRVREVFQRTRPRALRLEGADLEGVMLAGADLSGASLIAARLAGADLREASLDGACLARAFLSSADLRRASALNADFSEANLDHVDAQEAILQRANLHGANLCFARFTRANLLESDLGDVLADGAGFLKSEMSPGWELSSTTGAIEPRVLELRAQVGHSSKVTRLAWMPGGRIIASTSLDGAILLLDAVSGRLLQTLEGHPGGALSVAWAPNGTRLASGGRDQMLRLWRPGHHQPELVLQHNQGDVYAVAWSPDGKLLAGASDKVRGWDSESGQLIFEFGKNAGAAAWSPDGQQLAVSTNDHIILWNLAARQSVLSFHAHQKPITALSWSPDGRLLASASLDDTAGLWNTVDGTLIQSLAHRSWVLDVSWDSRGGQLASASDDQRIRIWDSVTGKLIQSFAGHGSAFHAVSWSPEGGRLAAGSDDGQIEIWDVEAGLSVLVSQSSRTSAHMISWDHNAARLASSSADGIRIWDSRSGKVILSRQEPAGYYFWIPDGEKLLAIDLLYGEVRICDISEREDVILRSSRKGSYKPPFVAFSLSPDHHWLAYGDFQGLMYVGKTADHASLRSIKKHNSWVHAIAWSPDANLIASAASEPTIQIWEPSSGRSIHTLLGHEDMIGVLAWASNGALLASASTDATVRLWEPVSGQCLATLEGHLSAVVALSWASDNGRLASASVDGTVRLWEPSSGSPLHTLDVPAPIDLEWSPDGTRIAVTSNRGFIELWNVATDPPRPLGRLYQTPDGTGFAATPDGYVSGPPEALEWVRWGDGWALYDLTDVPDRLSPERVAAALRGEGLPTGRRRRGAVPTKASRRRPKPGG